MKKNKFYGVTLPFLMIAFTLTSCVQDGDFNLPNVLIEEPNITANSNIMAIKTALQQAYNSKRKLVYTFLENTDNPTYIEAYVVSSDAAGNFYKKLIIQDSPKNPTAGIEILVNNTSLSETYDIGRKIYVKLDGLSVSYDDGETNPHPDSNDRNGNTKQDPFVPGKYILGVLNGGQVDNIPSTSIEKHIFRSATIATIVPNTIAVKDISEAHINTMIEFSSVQIVKNDVTKTFSGSFDDQFDGFRTIFECDTQKTIPLQTSTFASFTSNIVPNGKGSFKGILSKDYRAEFFVVIANTPSDLDFTDINRCDPVELDCGIAIIEGNNIIFSDDFENQTTDSLVSGNGWTNHIQKGTRGWKAYTSSGTNPSQGISVKVDSYNSGDVSSIAWLISPPIDVSSNSGVTIKFETSNSYSDNSKMELVFSIDWNGTIEGFESATWGFVPKAYITQNSDSFSNWYDSGLVDLSCAPGTTYYFAFKYTGSGNTDSDGTYELDNIRISSN